MKKIVIVLLTVIASSCTGLIGNGYKISGEVKGLADGTKVYLEKQDPDKGIVIPVDTVKIEKGKFVFEGKADEPEIHGIRFHNIEGGFAVVVEKGNIDVKVNKDSLSNPNVSGTDNNDELHGYIKKMATFQKKIQAFETSNMQAMQTAQAKSDEKTITDLRTKYAALQKEVSDYNEKYISEKTKSLLAALLLEGMVNQSNGTPENVAELKKLYDNLDSQIKNTKVGKRINTKITRITKYVEDQKKKIK